MLRRFGWGELCLLPVMAALTSCASYTAGNGDVVADVYVQTSPNTWEADPSIPASTLAFRADSHGNLTPVKTPWGSETLVAAGQGMVFTSDYSSGAIHRYAVGQDGTASGPVSTLHPAKYDSTACAPPWGTGMLDPTGTYLTVELKGQSCDVWQTFQLEAGGGYKFLGEDDSGQWVFRDGEVYMGFAGESEMSADGRFAYGVGGEGAGGSFLAAMKRDSSGVLRIWNNFDWPFDTQYRYQPGGPSTDGNNHVAMLMAGSTSANGGQTWLASFSIDPATGNLEPISTYDNMPQTIDESYGAAFSPLGDTVAVGGMGFLETFLYHADGPATPAATLKLPGESLQGFAWDKSHHLYVLTSTDPKPPAIARFSLYVFTVTDGQFTPAPGSPWNVPNGRSLVVVPRG
ncbi:MAG: hypothetical protein ACLGSD_08410 [Acidobacteriota bacterium]